MKAKTLVIGLFACVLMCSMAQASNAATYTVIDLGTLGGSYSYPIGMNSVGQVVGYSTLAGNGSTDRAALFSDMRPPTDLAALGGANSYAYSINNSGQIVGYAYTPSGDPRATLFGTSGGSNTSLGTLGGTRSAALSINDKGQVVGEANTFEDAASRATLFNTSGGANVDLGTLGGTSSSAYGINNNGQIVGYSYLAGNWTMRATLFGGSDGSTLDLGKLPDGASSIARAINDSGQVVGESYNPYVTLYYPDVGPAWNLRATLFSSTGDDPRDLGTLGGANSRAWDISDSGQVVGQAQLQSGEWDAFIWEDGGMLSLDSLIDPASGWNLYEAHAINDSGQIAVLGGDARGGAHALLLNPFHSNETPEPETFLLMLVGLSLLTWRRRAFLQNA